MITKPCYIEAIIDFLTSFDPRTIALLVIFAFFIETTAFGAQAYLIREYRGIGTAMLGNLMLAIGFFLYIQRGMISDFLSIVGGNVFIILGPCIFYVAVCQFTGYPVNRWLVAAVMAGTFFSATYFHLVVNDIGKRIAVTSFCATIIVVTIAHRLWQARHSSYRFSAILTFIPFALYGVFLVVRTIATLFDPPQAAFVNTPMEVLTYFLLFFISFLWTIGFVLMVSQRLQTDLRELATIDSLTRIPNRRAAQMFLEKELSRAQRQKSQFSVLLIDIDNFKQINDSLGHAMGDHVLIKSAEVFQASIRKQDLVGRWGGEEFLIVLSGEKLENAKCLAERLRGQIERAKYRIEKQPTTISVGIAHSDGSEALDRVLKRADDALYVAKATKNAVIVANED